MSSARGNGKRGRLQGIVLPWRQSTGTDEMVGVVPGHKKAEYTVQIKELWP